MHTRMIQRILTLCAICVVAIFASAGATLVPVEHTYDFGAVAIEFFVTHDFKFVNVGSTPIRIDSARSDCGCTTVILVDSLAGPNDTAVVRVIFETTNFYGRISKLLSVYTTERGNSPLQVYYLATVGQWLYGIKPEPISLFFLPPQKSRIFSIINPAASLMEVSAIESYDSLVTVRVIHPSAPKGGKVDFEVVPREKLAAGTYNTNVRVMLAVRGAREPLFVTVPVKVVRY